MKKEEQYAETKLFQRRKKEYLSNDSKMNCSERCDWPNCTLKGCRQREIDPNWDKNKKGKKG
jgi:hypothetical protein